MARITMVAGGSRSGKSSFAEARLHNCKKVIYIATLEVLDAEMGDRVDRHRQRRPADWRTAEVPHALKDAITDLPEDTEGVLIDCLTGWLSNRLLAISTDTEAGAKEIDNLLAELDGVLTAAESSSAEEIIFVTNETGCGVVPPSRLGRSFRDLQGWANQHLAKAADVVYLLQFGLASKLK